MKRGADVQRGLQNAADSFLRILLATAEVNVMHLAAFLQAIPIQLHSNTNYFHHFFLLKESPAGSEEILQPRSLPVGEKAQREGSAPSAVCRSQPLTCRPRSSHRKSMGKKCQKCGCPADHRPAASTAACGPGPANLWHLSMRENSTFPTTGRFGRAIFWHVGDGVRPCPGALVLAPVAAFISPSGLAVVTCRDPSLLLVGWWIWRLSPVSRLERGCFSRQLTQETLHGCPA